DETIIYRLAFHLHGRTLMRAHQARIHAAHADGGDVQLPADAENLRVHQAVEHHAGDFHRLLVGHSPARHHVRRDAETFLDLRQLRSATVHQHDADADLVQDRDLLDQRARGLHVAKHTAARLDDEHLALVHANVRGGAAQRANGNGGIGTKHHGKDPWKEKVGKKKLWIQVT